MQKVFYSQAFCILPFISIEILLQPHRVHFDTRSHNRGECHALQELIFGPFTAAGLAFMIASTSFWKLSANCSSVKDALPIGTWIMFVLSNLYSILPTLISLIAFVTCRSFAQPLLLGSDLPDDCFQLSCQCLIYFVLIPEICMNHLPSCL